MRDALRLIREGGGEVHANVREKLLDIGFEVFVNADGKCEGGFRAALKNPEKARERLEIERARPLDAKRALSIAWDYYAETTKMIAGSHGRPPSADVGQFDSLALIV